jgi:hypothetical protein
VPKNHCDGALHVRKLLLESAAIASYISRDPGRIVWTNAVKGAAHSLVSALPRTESLSSGSVGLPSKSMSEESASVVANSFTCGLAALRAFFATTRASDISVDWRWWRENGKRVGGMRAAATQRPAPSQVLRSSRGGASAKRGLGGGARWHFGGQAEQSASEVNCGARTSVAE